MTETTHGFERSIESAPADSIEHHVEMRYFAGMTETQIALALDVTERTVRRDWNKAQLLLRDILSNTP